MLSRLHVRDVATLRLRMLATACLLASIATTAKAVSFVTLDDPLATGGTIADGISGSLIVGNYVTADGLAHGFIYDGSSYTTLDEPNAGTPTVVPPGQFKGTTLNKIDGSTIVGTYTTSGVTGGPHGFKYDGANFTSLNPPGSSTSHAWGISGGTIVGYYADSQYHGYSYDGATFAPLANPPAALGAGLPSDVSGTQVVGNFVDALAQSHGYLFDGTTFITIDDPLAVHGTFVWGIDSGQIVGSYYDAANVMHGFILVGGQFTTIDHPLAVRETRVTDIAGNTIVGDFVDAAGQMRGFVAQVPEPASIWHCACGLVSIVAVACSRRGRRTQAFTAPTWQPRAGRADCRNTTN